MSVKQPFDDRTEVAVTKIDRRMPRGGNERHAIHMSKADAAERCAMMIGVAGEGGIHEARDAPRGLEASPIKPPPAGQHGAAAPPRPC
jgi:hypothetical protein